MALAPDYLRQQRVSAPLKLRSKIWAPHTLGSQQGDFLGRPAPETLFEKPSIAGRLGGPRQTLVVGARRTFWNGLLELYLSAATARAGADIATAHVRHDDAGRRLPT